LWFAGGDRHAAHLVENELGEVPSGLGLVPLVAEVVRERAGSALVPAEVDRHDEVGVHDVGERRPD
jgi:hypothetical protein